MERNGFCLQSYNNIVRSFVRSFVRSRKLYSIYSNYQRLDQRDAKSDSQISTSIFDFDPIPIGSRSKLGQAGLDSRLSRLVDVRCHIQTRGLFALRPNSFGNRRMNSGDRRSLARRRAETAAFPRALRHSIGDSRAN